jgi:hypothetical protein
MFAEMRTGSNFLEANLNALPGVTCHGEAFNPHFIGKLNVTEGFGMTLAQRDADPMGFLARLRAQPGLNGFRYFHDHDPRVFAALMDDAGCAKIVLTRNPLESYVSWKIAQATGQWKLTNAKKLKTGKAVFDAAEFAAHVQGLQDFQVQLVAALQTRGQTAFWIDYEDIQDLAVLNGLAAFLGIAARLDAADPTLKKQNPEPLADKVENPDAMAAALAGIDWFGLSRTPNFEPRRGAAIPSFQIAGPLLHMPVKGGPEAELAAWLAQVGRVEGDLNQKSLRQWRKGHPGRRSFAVVRHPVARAFATFRGPILSGALPEVRQTFARTMGIDLPAPARADRLSGAEMRDAFLAFLRFAKLNLSGQTAVRVDAGVATQTAVLQGFAQHQAPDILIREARLAEGIAFLAAETGQTLPPAPAIMPDDTLAALYDREVEDAAREAYQRDYFGFGFTDWR